MDSKSGWRFGSSRGAIALLLLAIFVALLGSTLRAADREPAAGAGPAAAAPAALTNAGNELAAADDAFIAAAPIPPPALTMGALVARRWHAAAAAPARETEDRTSFPAVAAVGEIR